MSSQEPPPAAGYFAILSNGSLLKSEKHAQREGFWVAHVLRPRGAQSQGIAPERRLFPIQQTTVNGGLLNREKHAQKRRFRAEQEPRPTVAPISACRAGTP